LAYLLDTNAILFGLFAPETIKPVTRSLLSDPDVRVFASVASIYEISFKAELGKLKLPPNFQIVQHLIGSDVELLDITAAHAERASRLPLLIRDPWDRLIAAQAIAHHLSLVTSDAHIHQLGVRTIW
jgi:PIN domain nuclease of toxin-antitoxin system